MPAAAANAQLPLRLPCATCLANLRQSICKDANPLPPLLQVTSWLDESTLGLLFGMMILVGQMKNTGLFEVRRCAYAKNQADATARSSGGAPRGRGRRQLWLPAALWTVSRCDITQPAPLDKRVLLSGALCGDAQGVPRQNVAAFHHAAVPHRCAACVPCSGAACVRLACTHTSCVARHA